MKLNNILGVVSVTIGVLGAFSTDANKENYTKLVGDLSKFSPAECENAFEILIWRPNNLKAIIFGDQPEFETGNCSLSKFKKDVLISKLKEKVTEYEFKYNGQDGIDRMDQMSDSEFDQAFNEKLVELESSSNGMIREVVLLINKAVSGIKNGGDSLKVIANHAIFVHGEEKVTRVLNRSMMNLAKKITHAQYIELRKAFIWGQSEYNYLDIKHYDIVIKIINQHIPSA